MTSGLKYILAQSQSAEKKLITVASGKGGVGKTWFSITLAHALTLQGKNVLVFDGDLGLANIDIQLGLTPKFDISHMFSKNLKLQDIIQKYVINNSSNDGFDVIAGRSGSGNMRSLQQDATFKIRTALINIADAYDHVILDLGAGIDNTVMALANNCGRTIIVISTEPTSLTDAYAFIKLRRMRDPLASIEIIVNNASAKKDAERIFETLHKACINFLGFSPKLLGIIKHDRHVQDSIRAQMPLLTRFQASAAAVDVMSIAKSLI